MPTSAGMINTGGPMADDADRGASRQSTLGVPGADKGGAAGDGGQAGGQPRRQSSARRKSKNQGRGANDGGAN